MSATADVLALASAEFDVSGIPEGTTLTVKWRGKPVFIRHRTDAEVSKEANVEMSSLKDPQADAARAKDPKWYDILDSSILCCLTSFFFKACGFGHMHTSWLRANFWCG